MNKGGIGLGSASVLLVYAVLGMAIFSLISWVSARNDKILAEAEAHFVINYYKADTLAEQIFAELLATPRDMLDETSEFVCGITDDAALYVKIAFHEDSYDILSWQVRDIAPWEININLPVWTGLDFDV